MSNSPHPGTFPSDGRGRMLRCLLKRLESEVVGRHPKMETMNCCSFSHRMGEGKGEGFFEFSPTLA